MRSGCTQQHCARSAELHSDESAPYSLALCLDLLCMQWTSPLQLHGIGQYAADAYFMFCRGQWQQVTPADKDLRAYHEWLVQTGGQGSGLQRESGDPEQQLQRLTEQQPAERSQQSAGGRD